MAVMLKEVIHGEDNSLFKDGINVKMSKKKKRKRNFNDDKIIFHGNPSLPRKRKPYKEYKDFDDVDDDYEIDFYEDKNYEYIDQDHVESLVHHNIVNNHKMGLAFTESENYNFSPLDYNNYDYEEVGNLNFRGAWSHHQLDRGRRYNPRRYSPKNKIFFSKRKLRKCFLK